VYIKSLYEISPKIKQQLMILNCHQAGLMQCMLKSLINKIEDKTADSIVNFEKSNPIVFYIKDKNDSIKS